MSIRLPPRKVLWPVVLAWVSAFTLVFCSWPKHRSDLWWLYYPLLVVVGAGLSWLSVKASSRLPNPKRVNVNWMDFLCLIAAFFVAFELIAYLRL